MPKIGTTLTTGVSVAVDKDTKIANAYTTPNTENHTYNRVFVYGVGSSATCYLKFGIYTSAGHSPDALVANSTASLPVFTTTEGWRSVEFLVRPTLVKNTEYFLAVLAGDSAGESVSIRTNAGAVNQAIDPITNTYAAGLSDPYDAGSVGLTFADTKKTIYIRGRPWCATMGKRWRR
jgi:hypothetical protein